MTLDRLVRKAVRIRKVRCNYARSQWAPCSAAAGSALLGVLTKPDDEVDRGGGDSSRGGGDSLSRARQLS